MLLALTDANSHGNPAITPCPQHPVDSNLDSASMVDNRTILAGSGNRHTRYLYTSHLEESTAKPGTVTILQLVGPTHPAIAKIHPTNNSQTS